MPLFGKKKTSSDGPQNVALIGCGPAGMCLLHALAKRKQDPKAKNLPNITCFERAASPGGLWRDVPSDDPERKKVENKALMYNDMWSNIPKELCEYFDYTWDEHFKKPTPAFLPRKDIFEYLVARNSVDGALDDVKFNHTVTSVKWLPSENKFSVTVRDDVAGKSTTEKYDKCVWAAGVNGYLEDPDDVDELLDDFEGKTMHSIEATEDFEGCVKGKRVMLIGDSSSAEDLALRAVKLGAEKVYITSRQGDGDCAETGSWPEDKVEMVYGQPYKVLKGKSFKVQAVYWSEKKGKWRKDDEEEPVKLKDIDTAIMCTGYNPNLEFVDENLRFDDDVEWQCPKGWTMDNNAFSITFGNITPSKHLFPGATCTPDIYRGLLIANPNMMYLCETDDPASPLLHIDVNAWLILGYLTGDVDIPKEKDMVKANQKQLEAEMQIPFLRSAIDLEYAGELDELDETHWSENPDDERNIVMDKQASEFVGKVLARDAKTAKYPADFGKFDKLNDKGQQLVKLMNESGYARSKLKKDDPDAKWKTFREYNPGQFKSIYTGTEACELPGRWMDLNITSMK
mmetsp:Transcript_44679/g.54084  ORF Transcript_44679/g.54084 Transcript_44679/m.54084 type:complete len:569 (-) Transcript_44679:199-1905(-)